MRLLTLLFCITLSMMAAAQSRVFIHDGRQTAACTSCEKLFIEKPKEVLFGIDLRKNGDIYFTTSDKQWFNKLITGPQDGVTTDIVTKDQFGCQAPLPDDNSVNKGFVLPPVYMVELKKNLQEIAPGFFTVKIGRIPPSLANKELEGNLVIVKNGVVCKYTSFVDIPRSRWGLLPLGLYTDTLLNVDVSDDTAKKVQNFYTKKLQFSIPFQKGKTTYNGRVKYNICVLNFHFWQYDSSQVQAPAFFKYINDLSKFGINTSLVKRMLINYNIVMCGLYMYRYNYAAKDKTLEYIRDNYAAIPLSDADILALAKYLCYYSQCNWAESLLEKRVHKLDVDEDLLFYYLNLKLFEPTSFGTDPVKKAALNGININARRFCRFFNSSEKDGASFQLIRYDELKKLYCESCR